MKHVKWMIALSLASAGLGAAGGVFAAKSKEIVVTPDSDVKFQGDAKAETPKTEAPKK